MGLQSNPVSTYVKIISLYLNKIIRIFFVDLFYKDSQVQYFRISYGLLIVRLKIKKMFYVLRIFNKKKGGEKLELR